MPRNRSEKVPPELVRCAVLYARWAKENGENGKSEKEYEMYIQYAQYELKMPRVIQARWRDMALKARSKHAA